MLLVLECDSVVAPVTVKRLLQRMVVELPVLRSRITELNRPLVRPRFQEVPIDISHHFKTKSAKLGKHPSASRSKSQLFDLLAEISDPAWDYDRPLWTCWLVTDEAAGRSVVVFRIHHVLTDGRGLALLAKDILCGPVPESDVSVPAARPVPGIPSQILDDAQAAVGSIVQAITHRAADGAHAFQSGGPKGLIHQTVVATMSTLALIRPDRIVGSRSIPLTAYEGRSQFALASTTVNALHDAAQRADATVNDVYIAIAIRTIAEYRRALDLPEVESLHVGVPVAIHLTGDEPITENDVTMTVVGFPADIEDFDTLIRRVREISKPRIADTRTVGGYVNRELVLALPTKVRESLARAQLRTVDTIATNVPGPKQELRVGDARVTELYMDLAAIGTASMFCLTSYGKKATILAELDIGEITEPAKFEKILRAQVRSCRQYGMDS